MLERALVMRGTLDRRTSLDEVLSAVGMSRQWMEIVLEDDDRPQGTILCKSGQVMEAFAQPDQEGVDAFLALYRAPGCAFAVYRRPAPPERVAPLGALTRLIAHAQAATPETGLPRAEGVVLEGTFADFAIREVLEVLSLGRQELELAAARADGSRVVLATRAGRLLSCEDPVRGLAGIEAFRALLADPGERFRVTRRPPGPAAREPLGRLADLLAQDPPEPRARPEAVVLEGTFAESPVPDVFDVVGLTRQRVELVLRDEQGTRGAVVVKAGRVLEARALRSGASGRAAFLELARAPGRSFQLVRRAGDDTDREPIGRLSDLLEEAWRREPELRDDDLVRIDEPAPTASRPPSAATPILQGRFGETRVTDLLETVGLSRQVMEIRVTREERPLGRLLVKSGQILDVQHGELRGRPAFRALLADPGTRYRVTRSTARIPAEPLGNVADWLRAERERPALPAEAPGLRGLVLEGSFARVPILDVLRTASLSRQHLVLLLRSSGKARGRLVLKAGRVLDAEHAGRRGVDGVRAMLADPGDSFVVYRMPNGSPLPEPLGTLDELLAAPAHTVEVAAPDSPTVFRPTAPALAPAPAPPAPPPPAAAPAPLETGVRELTDAIAALARAIGQSRASADRPWLAALTALQLVTLVLVIALLLAGGGPL